MDHGQDTGFASDMGNTAGDAGSDVIERLAQVVAHLAAQLTIAQLQLRALGTALSEAGAVDEGAVRERLAELARAEAGAYLAQNLGDALGGIVETEALAAQIVVLLTPAQ